MILNPYSYSLYVMEFVRRTLDMEILFQVRVSTYFLYNNSRTWQQLKYLASPYQ